METTTTTTVSADIIDKISLPANIGDILKSIKSVTSASTKVQNMEIDEEYVPTSVQMSNLEYKSTSLSFNPPVLPNPVTFPINPLFPDVPAVVNPTTMDIDERVFVPLPTQTTTDLNFLLGQQDSTPK